MSRLSTFIVNAQHNVHRAMSKAMVDIEIACDDADRWLTQYAKNKQADDDDMLAVIAARQEIARVRALRLK